MIVSKKWLAALFLTSALPGLAQAMPHDGDDAPMDKGYGSEHHRGPEACGFKDKDLDLTKEQQRKVHRLKGEEMKARHELVKRYLEKLPETDQQAMKKDMQSLHDKNMQSVRAELTPEQQKTFDAQQKEHEQKRQEFEEFLKWKATQAKP